MIKRFRRRFILISMILVGAVSLLAFGIIAVMGYQQVVGIMNTTLKSAVEADPHDSFTLPDVSSDDEGIMGRENSIPVYVVSVYYGAPTKIIVNESSTGIMDADTSKVVVPEALERIVKGHASGALPQYRLFYRSIQTDDGYRIAFANTSFVADDFGQRMTTLAVSWLLLMAALFVVVICLSRYVTRPVEKAWKDQQRFVADASHELKTPLTVILANASILRDSPEKTVAEQDAWVEGISAEAQRMQQLTENMLTLAQADAGVDRKQLMADVDFSSVVEGQVLQFDAVAFERSLTIEDSIEENLHVTGDELRLEGMVKTLLENACKYAEQPSAVGVVLGRVRGSAMLSVTSHGEPIPPEDLPHLFDRFYRSDKARANEGETASFGLGLSIAKSTVELHKGTIDVSSAGSTTTFTVRLPLAK